VFSQLPASLPFWQESVSDTVAHAKTLSGISASQVGLLSFSRGGNICLRLSESAQTLVEFFAPELPELGGLAPPVISAPHVQIHHGTADLLVPFSNAGRISAALKGWKARSSSVFPMKVQAMGS
jgi:predicted esterase